jgi:uncharacterized protein (TIGR02145 family)
MKNHILRTLAISLITGYYTLITCGTALAQVPQGIPYQAIARNASGVAIANTAVKVRFSIRDSIATGPVRYQETHSPTTSTLGLFSVNVGMGTVVSGSFSGINWGKNAKFLQVELNTTGGTAYTDLGTTQMMSVPYALFAGNVNGFPAGGTEGQSLNICGGQPTWTTNGVCPGRISSLNCAGAVQSGTAYATLPIQASFSLSYDGGNGGPYQDLSVASTGLGGLTASLVSGNFNNGSGTLSIAISGTAATSGTAGFALNIGGQFCSLQLTVSPLPPFPIDVDGNIYQTVVIGNQIWMKENLKVSRYRNGNAIPTNLTDSDWQNTTSGAYAIYNNDAANNTIYGKLYNWYAVADLRGLCPVGWHVPTDYEWYILENYLDSSINDSNSIVYRGIDAGGKLKAVSNLWASPNIGATNSSGFTALPAGLRSFTGGQFTEVGVSASWWTSTNYSDIYAMRRTIGYDYATAYRYFEPKTTGFSVRCIKD